MLITKALIEIPPRFADQPPVNPPSRAKVGSGAGWTGARGLADDVRYYGAWMRDEAVKRIGHLYPRVTLSREQGGGQATVIAWLWARTVTCPNPACRARMPLVRSFALSTKPSKKAWVEPVVDQAARTVRFEVRTGQGEPPEGTVNRRGATCIVCDIPVPFDHVRAEGKAGRMGAQMMAVVAEGHGSRLYLPPTQEHEATAAEADPQWAPETDLPEQALGFRVQLYGMTRHRDLFTPRQLVALTTFSDLVGEAREKAHGDALVAGLADDGVPLAEGGRGATGYADSVATYTGLTIGRSADFWCTNATWSAQAKNELVAHAFTRQALPITWDFGEVNPFSESGGNFVGNLNFVAKAVGAIPAALPAYVEQRDATEKREDTYCYSTDPPYYDNIGYADLSDFFYVWLRRSLKTIFPDLFSTLLVPKVQELIATPHRFAGNREEAQQFFESGLKRVFERMCMSQVPDYPLTVYYAFKQAEADERSRDQAENDLELLASTGWETMLQALFQAGLAITGTWPMRTERSARSVSVGTNALASSIILVCRPRATDAPKTTRRAFLDALRRELPGALRDLQHGNIAPVDLAQASIGPGMAVYSRYAAVLDAEGKPVTVRQALQFINQALDEVLAEQEGEFDEQTRWAIAWYEQYRTEAGPYGMAETLSKAKNTSVAGVVEAGFLESRAGKVRLLRRDEQPEDWDPAADRRLTVWEGAQHLVRALDRDGETGAARLLARLGAVGGTARDLAYRLYVLCERKGWAQEALSYNALVIAWPEITRLAAQQDEQAAAPRQQEMFR